MRDDVRRHIEIARVFLAESALGSDAFIAKLESRLGRRLRPLPRGRPREAPLTERKK